MAAYFFDHFFLIFITLSICCHNKMQAMEKAIELIKTRIIDRIIVVFFILLIPAYILSLVRWIDFGWQDISYFHTTIMLVLALVIIKRHKLSLLFKSSLLAIIFFIAGITSLYYLGLIGMHFWALLSVVTLTIFVSLKIGLVVFSCVSFAYAAMGWLYSSSQITMSVDAGNFINSQWHWLSVFTSIIAMLAFLVMSYSNLFEELKKKMAITVRIKQKLKKHERELLKTQKELSASLNKQEKLNSTKDKLFSVVAHDLRGPFQSLIALSGEIVKNFDDYSSEEKKRFITAMNGSINSTYKLLDDLLVWSKIQQQNDTIVPVRQNVLQLVSQVTESLKLAYEQKNVKLETDISDRLFLYVDKLMIAEVVRNLLVNALKFSHPKKGKVTVSARILNSASKEESVQICVSDNGVGIPAQKHSSVFNVAQNNSTVGTSNEKGTGLGLPICHDLINKHKGKIWIESKPDEGTSVCFRLPVHVG